MSTRDWKGYVVPSVFAFVLEVGKGILLEGYFPDSPHLYLNGALSTTAYISSKLIVELSMDEMFSDVSFIQNGFDRVAEPTLHGVIYATLGGLFDFDATATLRGLDPKLRNPALPAPSGWKDRFIDSAAINISSTYLSEPLIN